jgi:uncharacterized protein YndB with AHSA1/START domain
MSAKSKAATGQTGRKFIITRTFDAPRERVFQAWTEPAHLAQWWGPRGFTNPVCEWDVRPGGKIYDVMRAPNGVDYPMGGTFREIVAPRRLVFTSGALDPKGAMLFEFLHTATFITRKGKTLLTLRSEVIATTPGADRYIGGFDKGMTSSLEKLAEHLADTASREIVITRVVAAPRERVWRAMTDPTQVVQWWGPKGFTTTIEKMDVRPGGTWKHFMHGPDGTDYPNKSIFREIVKPERIVFTHGGGEKGGPGVTFVATWSFAALAAGRTRVTIHMVFPTAEARDTVVKVYGAIKGGRETLGRLAKHLPTMRAEAASEFVITRVFDAPRDLVWRAWTDVEHLHQWFGPKGFTRCASKLDFRPGGIFHYSLKSPSGHEMWGKWVFKEIVPLEKLVLISSFSDAKGGVTRHPMSAQWPLEILSTTTFTEHKGKTTLTLRWSPYKAKAAERQAFDGAHDSMTQGWGGTMDQLAAHLAKS